MVQVLVTGAAGGVARQLRPGLAGLTLRLTDCRPISGWDAAEAVTGDLADARFARDAVDGAEAVVHLAANASPSAPWDDLRAPNGDAVVNVLEAARDAGVRRVVLASSVHAAGGYFPATDGLIDPAWPPAPCCTYGATKVFAEAMGRVVAATSGTPVVCLRLGACLPAPPSRVELAAWLGPADLQQVVRAALDTDVRFGVYFGISASTPAAFDLTNARRDLGYEPVLDSAAFDRAGLPSGESDLCAGSGHDASP